MTAVVNLRDFRVRSCVLTGDVRTGRWWYRLPADVVRIDRVTRWGNPYRVRRPNPEPTQGPSGEPLTRESAIDGFCRYAVRRLSRSPDWLEPLRGKRLACWCAPLPCHGDVIVDLLRLSQDAADDAAAARWTAEKIGP